MDKFIIIYLLACVVSSPFKHCRFIKGDHVAATPLSEELIQAIGIDPIPKGISYIISTKVNDSGKQNVLQYSLVFIYFYFFRLALVLLW